jgi:DNA (cytosine-5)-methyltransferase 1
VKDRKNNRTQRDGTIAERREAMGIDWLPNSRLKEAIPPAYSQHIGVALLARMAVVGEQAA